MAQESIPQGGGEKKAGHESGGTWWHRSPLPQGVDIRKPAMAPGTGGGTGASRGSRDKWWDGSPPCKGAEIRKPSTGPGTRGGTRTNHRVRGHMAVSELISKVVERRKSATNPRTHGGPRAGLESRDTWWHGSPPYNGAEIWKLTMTPGTRGDTRASRGFGDCQYPADLVPPHITFKLRQGAGRASLHCHVSCSFGPHLPAEVGSGASMCPVAPNLATLPRWSLTLLCVPRPQTSSPY
jgi:hypothetical protein